MHRFHAVLALAISITTACGGSDASARLDRIRVESMDVLYATSDGEVAFLVLTPFWEIQEDVSARASAAGARDELRTKWITEKGGEFSLMCRLDGPDGSVTISGEEQPIIELPLAKAPVFSFGRTMDGWGESSETVTVYAGHLSAEGLKEQVKILLEDHPGLLTGLHEPAPVEARWIGKANLGAALLAEIEIENVSDRRVQAIRYVIHGRNQEGLLVRVGSGIVEFIPDRPLVPGEIRRRAVTREAWPDRK